VYSVEVENVLMAHPDIVEAAVVGRPDAVLGERVHAVVVPRADANSADLPGALKAFCAQRLSDYKVPETFTVVTGPLARNPNGKLLKTELRTQLLVRERQERTTHDSA
jgi:acyl-CoA synthetase (AMP-forming)/AMP-acid ligase II